MVQAIKGVLRENAMHAINTTVGNVVLAVIIHHANAHARKKDTKMMRQKITRWVVPLIDSLDGYAVVLIKTI